VTGRRAGGRALPLAGVAAPAPRLPVTGRPAQAEHAFALFARTIKRFLPR